MTKTALERITELLPEVAQREYRIHNRLEEDPIELIRYALGRETGALAIIDYLEELRQRVAVLESRRREE